MGELTRHFSLGRKESHFGRKFTGFASSYPDKDVMRVKDVEW